MAPRSVTAISRNVFGSRERSGAPRSGYSIDHVVEFDGRLVVMGTTYTNPLDATGGTSSASNLVVWQSFDAVRWTRTDLTGDDNSTVGTAGIAVHDGVLVAAGWEVFDHGANGHARPRVWRSTDGIQWTASPLIESSTTDIDVMTVVATESGFVAAGRANGHAAAWSSSDGIVWDLTALNDGGVAADQTSMVSSAAVSNGMLVAIGAVQRAGADGTIGWGSTDGESLHVSGQSELAIWNSTAV
jgi:hypothetical protein